MIKSHRTMYISRTRQIFVNICKKDFLKEIILGSLIVLQYIHSMKQGEMSVSEFYTNLKIIWEELESLQPTPKCTCEVRCRCSFHEYLY